MKNPQIEAQRWFQQAQADLEVVRTLRNAGHAAAACFHSQQAAEKALKAMLYRQGHREVPGYSVRELAKRCEAYDPVFKEIAKEATLLDQFYIPTRYPNGLPFPAVPSEAYTDSQAEVAEVAATRILHHVQRFLHARDEQEPHR